MIQYLGWVTRILSILCSFKGRTHWAAELNRRVFFSFDKSECSQIYHLNKVECSFLPIEEKQYKINVILSCKSYFILQGIYWVKLHPYPLHSSAKGTWTQEYPIGHPHLLASKGLARRLLENQLFVYIEWDLSQQHHNWFSR